MPLLGCIADDFTGATDLAGMLVKGGMRTLQTIGVPTSDTVGWDAVDAVVVALKSRSIPAADAVAQSLDALAHLRSIGCRSFLFKYCSTFDSSDEGNIGPVIDAMMTELDVRQTIACPAFPENGRTVYRGHLFVGDALLNESGMQNHPLTPMRDANLVRVLQRQTTRKVGLLRYDSVARSAEAVELELGRLRADGVAIAIADAVSDSDLVTLGDACADMPLVTGGSGIALGLPDAYRRRGRLSLHADAAALPAVPGRIVILSGSCSTASNAQVARWRTGFSSFELDPLALAAGAPVVANALSWIEGQGNTPALIYATASPERVATIQAELGAKRAGTLVEHALAEIARHLFVTGTRNFVVAGGETSGAIVGALGVETLRIGAPIDPGVPRTYTEVQGEAVALVLKSGNFGREDFFERAVTALRGSS